MLRQSEDESEQARKCLPSSAGFSYHQCIPVHCSHCPPVSRGWRPSLLPIAPPNPCLWVALGKAGDEINSGSDRAEDNDQAQPGNQALQFIVGEGLAI